MYIDQSQFLLPVHTLDSFVSFIRKYAGFSRVLGMKGQIETTFMLFDSSATISSKYLAFPKGSVLCSVDKIRFRLEAARSVHPAMRTYIQVPIN
jgi:hypothetical protein